MTEVRPVLALRVADLEAGLRFYVDGLGCTVTARPAAGVAVIAADGDPFLLAGPGVADPTPYLAAAHLVLAAGERFYLDGGDLAARLARVWAGGLPDARIVETSWGDRSLDVRDPDGYSASFWAPARHAPATWLALYERGPAALEAALAGLAEGDLDLARAPGTWTIREIVHHTAEADAMVLLPIMLALAEPGREYISNRPSRQPHRDLDYAGRAIAPALPLLRAVRAHVLQLIGHLPGAWDRALTLAHPPGRQVTVGDYISAMARHALEHAEEIAAIRRRHGR